MEILVTGCKGQLGTHIRLLAEQRATKNHYHFVDIDDLDITCEEALWSYFRHYPTDVVINCAAYTNVDKAESDEVSADKVNHHAVALLAENCKQVNATLIHISTDYVFGGNQNNTPCDESEPVNPTGAYGRTKLAGEQAIVNSGCKHLIFRTAWLYSIYGKNFVKTMLDVTANNPTRKVVIDQVGTPTFAGDLAEAIFTIVENGTFLNHQGLYHFSNEGVCSWYDFAQAIQECANRLLNQPKRQCLIVPCRSSEFPSPVKRPAFSVLDKTRFKQTFGLQVPYWYDALQRCILQFKEQ